MSRQTPESKRAGLVCALIGAALIAGFLAINTTVLSTAASAMALVINGAR